MSFVRMTEAQLRKALRKKECARREAAQKAREEIVALFKPSEQKGKLWGENSFTAMAEAKNRGEGVRWSTDAEAEVCSDVEEGEDDTTVKTANFQLAYTMVVETIMSGPWGQPVLELFLNWLTAPVLEVAQDFGKDAGEVLAVIMDITAECRRKAGTDPKVFPFPEEIEELRKWGY